MERTRNGTAMRVGAHPKREGRQAVQARNEVGVVDVERGPQDGIRPDHSRQVSDHPILAQRVSQPGRLTKASCAIPPRARL